MLGGEIATECHIHPSGRWITLAVLVRSTETLSMVLDTGSPVSALSLQARAALAARGFLTEGSQPRTWLLRDVSIEARPIPDLEVRVLARLDRLQIVGLLGLDFLRMFEDVHFNVPTLRLRLIPTQ